MKNKSGFTLLEIIIVIIIIGVLASLALPRFFRTVEYSRASEALASLGAIRQSFNRCYLFDSNYTICGNDWESLDIGNMSAESTLFNYVSVSGLTTFIITAQRTTTDGGDGVSVITIDQDGNKGGSGYFTNIR